MGGNRTTPRWFGLATPKHFFRVTQSLPVCFGFLYLSKRLLTIGRRLDLTLQPSNLALTPYNFVPMLWQLLSMPIQITSYAEINTYRLQS